MSVRHIPNILSVLRMALSLGLLLFLNDRLIYFAVFLLACLSDMLDGIIARKANAQSQLGSRLDTAGDFLMFMAMLASVIIWSGEAALPYVPYVAGIALVRFASAAISAIKFHKPASVHTWANKAAGLTIFAAFSVYVLTDELWAFIPGCVVAAVSAIEEAAILITAKQLDTDRKSIFIKTEEE